MADAWCLVIGAPPGWTGAILGALPAVLPAWGSVVPGGRSRNRERSPPPGWGPALAGPGDPQPRRGSTMMATGSAGQAKTHSPQPVQTSATTAGWPTVSPSPGAVIRIASSG